MSSSSSSDDGDNRVNRGGCNIGGGNGAGVGITLIKLIMTC